MLRVDLRKIRFQMVMCLWILYKHCTVSATWSVTSLEPQKIYKKRLVHSLALLSCHSQEITLRDMEMKTEVALVAMNVGYAGMNVLMRVALAQGMNQFVFVTYRQIIAVIAIAPIAYFKEKRVRTPMTVAIFFQIFMLALLGITFTQNFFLAGVYYTGPTFSAAMTNLIPACTFVLAVIFRLEEINIKTLGGKAKVIGTLGCVGGAMVMTFYKGPGIILLTSQSNSYTLLGSCALLGKVLSWSAWLILQVYVIKRYSAHLSMVTIMMVLGALQSGGVALILGGTKAQIWSLGWNMTTLTYLYSGIFCSAIAFFIQSWCGEKRGPLLVAVFGPLETIATVLMESIFLHYTLHVGSMLGISMIFMGLYLVLWGKANDDKAPIMIKIDGDKEVITLLSSSDNLLSSIIVDIDEPLLFEDANIKE